MHRVLQRDNAGAFIMEGGSYYDSHYLLQELVSNGEEHAIYRYVEQYNADSCTLLPMMLMMIRIKGRRGESLTESGWKDYIQQYLWDHNLLGTYHITQDDAHYSQSLINAHFPVSWKKIKLTDIQIVEIYNNSE
ncbi:hypothetical protein ARMGADRAFT_1037014 [Armillaria gallica]|uniref:Uncharacterized protein n=1 Tax=Armillaria gallica TaxID=47427 RepID=A0A2H3DAK4_ARMGA|nr:hypothetical protein ARMGADRAFT_1037014 [Armillaria gallica]